MSSTDYNAAYEQAENEKKYVKSAKSILRGLKDLREKLDDTQRRWIWELVQNAKDEQATAVRIERRADQLVFVHNGGPFQVGHQISLLHGDSSKSIAGTEKGKTGKFGTGFISTHILGEQVEVKGIVTYGATRQGFLMKLDRRGETPADLAQKIEATENQLRQSVNEHESTSAETSFTYFHATVRQRAAAAAGLADLVNTLPFTLVTLAGQLSELEILDWVANQHQTHRCAAVESITTGVQVYRITTTDNYTQEIVGTRFIISYQVEGFQLLAEVANLESYELVIPQQARPTLYWDFPLVGTESFYFPFIINGQPFFPTNARDGIELNNPESTDVQHNRRLVEQAQQAAVEFATWLLQRDALNRFLLANSRIPQGLVGNNNALNAKNWYENRQKVWRMQLRQLALVEPEPGYPALPLQQSRIPRFYNVGPAKESDHVALWDLAAPLFGLEILPRKAHLLLWLEAIGTPDEYESWGVQLWLDQKDLLVRIAEAGHLDNLPVGEDLETRLDWLRQVYRFMQDRGLEKLLNEYAVIPNHRGDFFTLEALCQENLEDPIPPAVLDILVLLDQDWRNDLMHPAVAPSLPELPKMRVRGLQEASNKINEQLTRYGYESATAANAIVALGPASPADGPRAEGLEIAVLAAIQQLQPINSSPDKFRTALLTLAQGLLAFHIQPLPADKLSTFDFQGPTYRWLRLLNAHLASAGSVQELQKVLGYASDSQTIGWLDRYLGLLENSQFKQVLAEKPIIPNRLHGFRLRADLFAYGTEQEPLDAELLRILAELSDNRDQRNSLLADGIRLPLDTPTYTRRLLGDDFTAALRLALATDENFEQLQAALADFVKWCSQDMDAAKDFVPRIIEEALHHRISYFVLERSGKTGQVMELAGHESLDDLLAIAASKADIAQLRKIAELVQHDPDMMRRLLDSAQDQQRERKRFLSLVEIGRIMEDLFAAALAKAGIKTELQQQEPDPAKAFSRYYGIGSYDFAIINQDEPHKRFLIELKSFAKGPNPQAIRLAQSQVHEAAQPQHPFGLCIIGREGHAETVTVDEVELELRYYRDLAEPMQSMDNKLSQLREWQQEQQPLYLELPEFAKTKVRVAHSFLDEPSRFFSFNTLVEDIRKALI